MFYTGHMASSPLSRVRNLEHPHRFEGLPENGKLLRTAALLGAVLLASAAASAEEWTFEVVDGTRVGTVSLVMENSGQRHISYYDSSFETRLKYAFHDGTSWTIEVVDELFTVGDHNSIAVDADGNPHISYHADHQDGGLKYAVRDAASSTWTVEIVDQGGHLGEYTSLALDGSGNPYISYWDSVNGDLKVASNTGSGWVIETVDSNGDTGLYTSIALDASDNPRVSYRSLGTNTSHLWFASFDGSWTIERAEASSRPQDMSLVLDESGNPLIAYYARSGSNLKFASRIGGTWSVQTVASAGNVGQYPSLALDPSGNPCISFRSDVADQDLQYAKHDGTSWIIETVDSAGNVGHSSALAIDSFGNIGISYADSTNSDLKFAFAQTPVALPTLSPGAVGLLLAALLGIGLAVRSGQEV